MNVDIVVVTIWKVKLQQSTNKYNWYNAKLLKNKLTLDLDELLIILKILHFLSTFKLHIYTTYQLFDKFTLDIIPISLL